MKTNAPGQVVGPHFRWHNFDRMLINSSQSISFSIPVPTGFCSAIVHAKADFNHSPGLTYMRIYQLAGRDIGYGTCLTQDKIRYSSNVLPAESVCSILRRLSLATSLLKVEFAPTYFPEEVMDAIQLSVLLLDKPVHEGALFRSGIDCDIEVTSVLNTPIPQLVPWTPRCVITNIGATGALQCKAAFHITGPGGNPTVRFNGVSAYVDLPVGYAAELASTTAWTPAMPGTYEHTVTLTWPPDQNLTNNVMIVSQVVTA
jgi:hypothetical protein